MSLIKIPSKSIGRSGPDLAYAFKIRINAMRLHIKMDYLKETEKKTEEINLGYKDIRNISDMRGMGIEAAARIVSRQKA